MTRWCNIRLLVAASCPCVSMLCRVLFLSIQSVYIYTYIYFIVYLSIYY